MLPDLTTVCIGTFALLAMNPRMANTGSPPYRLVPSPKNAKMIASLNMKHETESPA